MSTLAVKINPIAVDVFFGEDDLHVVLADGPEIMAPLTWFPRLLNATVQDRNDGRLIGNGVGIHWEKLDEDIAVSTLLRF